MINTPIRGMVWIHTNTLKSSQLSKLYLVSILIMWRADWAKLSTYLYLSNNIPIRKYFLPLPFPSHQIVNIHCFHLRVILLSNKREYIYSHFPEINKLFIYKRIYIKWDWYWYVIVILVCDSNNSCLNSVSETIIQK